MMLVSEAEAPNAGAEGRRTQPRTYASLAHESRAISRPLQRLVGPWVKETIQLSLIYLLNSSQVDRLSELANTFPKEETCFLQHHLIKIT